MYGAECWTTGVKEENILEKTEMRMLRRIKGVTVKDKMKSEDITKELGVGSIKSKARESRLRLFGHVHRLGTRKQPKTSDGYGDPRKATKRQTQGEMARSCGPGHAGTAGCARRCRRQKLLETTDPDRRLLPGIRREK